MVQTQTVQATSTRAIWRKRSLGKVNQLAGALGDSVLEELLVNRGIVSATQALRFLQPHYDELRLFGEKTAPRGLSQAVGRLVKAVHARERVIVFGDYDVDGVCAAAILVDVLGRAGLAVEAVLPDRERDGYGLQVGSIPDLLARKPSLVVTVDNGTQSHSAVEQLKRAGISVVILDHHEPGPNLPKADVVINPKQSGETATFRAACAAGLAFRLGKGLHDALGVPAGQEKWLLDLAAIATVCDMVPLAEDNRLIVHFGLKTLGRTRRIGLQTLIDQSAGHDPLSSEIIGFRLGPRLNAAGRLEHAKRSLDLMLTRNHATARQLTGLLDQLNRERQQLTRRIVTEALSEAQQFEEEPALVLASTNWPKGICGLAASKVAERLNRPVFVLEQGELCVGSGRSVPGVNLAEAIEQMRPLFVRAGGHAVAAGCTIRSDKLTQFRTGLVAFTRKKRGATVPAQILEYDTDLALAQVDLGLVNRLAQLEPYGMGNPRPVIKFTDCTIERMRLVGADQQHVSVSLRQGTQVRRAIAFSQAGEFNALGPGARLDILARVRQNEWGGSKSAELQILATMVR
ncbi:MAG: single-stranded-DNA-specific exonuclease RecJ [Parcubacteria group bacterium]